MVKIVQNTVLWTYVISDFNREEILEHFMKKNCKKHCKNLTSLKSEIAKLGIDKLEKVPIGLNMLKS